jgi:hypothetical protein
VLQADFRVEDLDWATELGDVLMERFHDREAAASSSPPTTTSA